MSPDPGPWAGQRPGAWPGESRPRDVDPGHVGPGAKGRVLQRSPSMPITIFVASDSRFTRAPRQNHARWPSFVDRNRDAALVQHTRYKTKASEKKPTESYGVEKLKL